jgi:hypothetical protein
MQHVLKIKHITQNIMVLDTGAALVVPRDNERIDEVS